MRTTPRTRRTPGLRALVSTFSLAVVALSSLSLAACDADPDAEVGVGFGPAQTELRSLPEGSVPSEPPTPCGDAVELPADGSLVVGEGVGVSVGFDDPQARMSGATAIEYSCSCETNDGQCQPQVVGSYIQCYSKSCKTCKLQQKKTSALTALGHLAGTCEPGGYDDDAATVRADQVQSWIADQGYPELALENENHDTTAAEGYGLVVEIVGGRMLSYQVPVEHFDADGELSGFVGPFNEGGGYVAQAAGGGKVTCHCEGSGDCSFEANGLCKGPCTPTGSQRGCYVKSTKALTPIFPTK